MNDNSLKFITCGSVDDGKSTLIGHLLYDAKLLFTDQEKALELDSKVGARGGEIDYSLLLDGLVAEREQGITIDVAYRYFTTEKRRFIVADTPGHEEYTRNMAVGASFAELAVILVDASQGLLIQTRRHARICSMMGIRHFVFAVNKMDLVDYQHSRFQSIERSVRQMMAEFSFASLTVIPVSATEGDNIVNESGRMPWYKGPTLLHYLESVDVRDTEDSRGFTLPVQRVCRPDHTFRGFQGEIATGSVSVGDEITVLPSGETARVSRILDTDLDVETCGAGHAVTICLDTEVDVSRGCVLVRGCEPECQTMLTASLLWMDDRPLVQGRNFWMKLGTQTVPATVMNIKYRIDVNSGERVPADKLYKNETAVCDISAGDRLVFEKFDSNKDLGALILIDRVSHMTSACGIVLHPLSRGENVKWQDMDITRTLRENQLGQKAVTIWFTGLSGSGKSALANALEKQLFALGYHTMLLDGDNIRMGLNKNLGFSEKDRAENIRRIANVAKLMNDAGLIVLTSFISPFAEDRENARQIIGDSFIEVYVSTPLEVCEQRDVKGLYKKAREGKIPNFTGISSPYEAPRKPDLTIDTSTVSLEDSTAQIMQLLEKKIRQRNK